MVKRFTPQRRRVFKNNKKISDYFHKLLINLKYFSATPRLCGEMDLTVYSRLIMKLFSKSIGAIFAVLVFSVLINAQTSWLGKYEFSEDGGKNAGGTKIFIEHEIEVRQTDDGLMATLQSNGYQTSKDLVCTAKARGDKLEIYLDSYGENNLFESYEQGDLLLTLENKTVKGKTELLTFWNKFQPSIEKNETSGKVYFKKVLQ